MGGNCAFQGSRARYGFQASALDCYAVCISQTVQGQPLEDKETGAMQLPPQGVNLHSSSALQHRLLGKEIMGLSPSRSSALGRSQNGPGTVPNIFECRHFILEGKMVYLYGHVCPMVHHPTSRTKNKPQQLEETQSRLLVYIIIKALTSNLRLKTTQHMGSFLICGGKRHQEVK